MCSSAVILVMDALREQEQRKPEPIQLLYTVQSMIDVSVDRLQGLRTQCLTSAEITQQEIRTLEGKLVKYFTQQILLKASFDEETRRTVSDIPRLELWLRAVGLGHESIEAICSRVSSLDSLRERSDHELRALMPNAREEETRRLCRAMSRLKAFIGIVGKNNGVFPESSGRSTSAETMELCWDSWDRRAEPRKHRLSNSTTNTPTHDTNANREGRSPYLNHQRKNSGHLPTPTNSLTKSRSHESQLSLRPDDLCENGQVEAGNSPRDSEPATPHRTNHSQHNNTGSAPRSPRTPTIVGGLGMVHDIAHRFTKTFNMIATCDYCFKQMLFGTGLKCKECKFKCHRECESKVPPSCGLPPEFVAAYIDTFHTEGGMGSPGGSRGLLSSLHRPHKGRPRHRPRLPTAPHSQGNAESSSNTSSCNSSSPSSPAPPSIALKHQFNFPEVKPATSSPTHTSTSQQTPRSSHDKEKLTTSVQSETSRNVSLSGSGSTDSGGARQDSLDEQDKSWPRQNSLSMKEWDIPFDELKLFEEIGTGRFGTVYRGEWHGAVAVKLLHVQRHHHSIAAVLDTFRHEVATFRKTRHENLVLFMGACMKPPKLAIITSLCRGNTLYTHIHLRRDKFNANRSVLVAQQISQGMGYLHARGIIHKDLKTKNIFLENGKVVITDFGLFSVTKLCFGNNARGDSLGIPAGWACYLAPELVRALTPHASLHLPFSKPTDVYAFGTVWYELLCGEWPFKGQPAEAVIWQVGRGVNQTLANLHASRDIKDILMMCWSYNASDRPDFAHLLSTLEKLPRKRLARSPSHPVHLSRSADSVL